MPQIYSSAGRHPEPRVSGKYSMGILQTRISYVVAKALLSLQISTALLAGVACTYARGVLLGGTRSVPSRI